MRATKQHPTLALHARQHFWVAEIWVKVCPASKGNSDSSGNEHMLGTRKVPGFNPPHLQLNQVEGSQVEHDMKEPLGHGSNSGKGNFMRSFRGKSAAP